MKIFFPSGFHANTRDFLQKAGYSSHIHSKTGRMNFVKRLTSGEYPHFHIYIEKNVEGKSYLSLHLDQKKPSYSGVSAHNAEYGGEVVGMEVKRLRQLIHAAQHEGKGDSSKKEGFFARLFGVGK